MQNLPFIHRARYQSTYTNSTSKKSTTFFFWQVLYLFYHTCVPEEIDMLELVITSVDILTEWVNTVVLSESTNEKGEITKLRVCLDPRDLNKLVKREQHYSKTIDEVVTQLNDAKFFILVVVKKGSQSMNQVQLLWTHLDSHGVRPDNSKVAAIQNMQPPEDVKSLQSFLGLVNYLIRYSGRLATITAPLRELTKKEVTYVHVGART